MPSEAGYDELRRVFDFLRQQKQVGPSVAGQYDSLKDGEVSITVVDADDLLDNPEGIIKAYCKEVGIEYNSSMLNWDTEEAHQKAKDAFEKWKGFHNDAIDSTSLKPRSEDHVSIPADSQTSFCITWANSCSKKKKDKTVEVEDKEWREKYGEKAQKVIREAVDANIPDYEYLKSFAIKV